MMLRIPPVAIALIVAVAAIAATTCAATASATEGAPDRMVIPEATVEGEERLVEIEWRTLAATVYGERAPTVVLIGGLNAPQAYWNAVVPALAELTTVVTYDRAGYGESTVEGLPLHGTQSALDLHLMLGDLKVPGPFIVVGHSYGASVARLFASFFPDDVGGIVLVDGQHESVLDEQRKLLTGDDLDTLEEMVVRMKEMASPESEMAYQEETVEQLRKSAPLPHVPYVVITAGDRSKAMPPVFSEEGRAALAELGIALQQKLVDLVPGGRQIVAEGVGHNIHVEQPDVLVAPLMDMIEEVRAAERE